MPIPIPITYPILELLGYGALAATPREVPSLEWSLRDNPIGRGLHWTFDPNWGGFATAMTYSPTTVERMSDNSYFGYQPYNNPDGTFGSYQRPNTLPEVIVRGSPNLYMMMNRVLDEAPTDSVPTQPTDTIGTTAPSVNPKPDDKETDDKKPDNKEKDDKPKKPSNFRFTWKPTKGYAGNTKWGKVLSGARDYGYLNATSLLLDEAYNAETGGNSYPLLKATSFPIRGLNNILIRMHQPDSVPTEQKTNNVTPDTVDTSQPVTNLPVSENYGLVFE